MPYKHIPVMLSELVRYLNCRPRRIYVDCTLGASGHSSAICEKIAPDGLLIGIDQDEEAIRNGKKILKPYEANIRLFHDNFINLPGILSQLNIRAVDGVLLDLGLSLYHIKSSGRGFSFQTDEPLDMRMNLNLEVKAEDIINMAKEETLKKIFSEYGEERWAGHIARRIVKERKLKRIDSSKQLAQIVCKVIPNRSAFKRKIHPVTKVFMALRIAVNKELETLTSFMDNVFNILNPKGRLCVLTFHSLEDRIIKQKIQALEGRCTCPPDFPKCVCNKKPIVISLTKKVLRPTKKEIQKNPMARSAKLRVAEKL